MNRRFGFARLLMSYAALAFVASVSCLTAGGVLAATTLVDLSPVANTSLENDGDHGWSEEGINDMYLYPPVPTGEFTRNGYSFRVIPKDRKRRPFCPDA